VVEIVEQVLQKSKPTDTKTLARKLIAGIVLTGGGAQLKHIKQLVE
jgi:cell division protein FtsA